jgi:hypothetical protein
LEEISEGLGDLLLERMVAAVVVVRLLLLILLLLVRIGFGAEPRLPMQLDTEQLIERRDQATERIEIEVARFELRVRSPSPAALK